MSCRAGLGVRAASSAAPVWRNSVPLSVSNKPGWTSTSVRWYGEEPEFDIAELQKRTMDVLRLFDKVDPSKVSTIWTQS